MAGSQKWNYWTKWTTFLKIPDTYCPVIFQKSCIDFTFPPAFFVRLLFEVNIFWEWSQTDGLGGRCFSGPVVDFWEFGRGPWEKSFCNLPLLNFLSVYTCRFLSFHDTVSGDLSQLSQINQVHGQHNTQLASSFCNPAVSVSRCASWRIRDMLRLARSPAHI